MDYKSFYFTKIFQLIRRDNLLFTKWCKKWGLSYMDLHILLAVHDTNGISEPTVLSEELLIPKQTITSMLDKLEKNGYLIRTHSNSDRRKVLISLNNKGQELVDMAVSMFAENEKNILKELGQDNLNKCIDVYDKALKISEKYILGNTNE